MIAGRIAWGLILVLLVTALVFVIFNVLPTGDPANTRTGATPQQIEQVRHAMGLDDPVYVQYGNFLGDLARFDLGTSYRYGVPVTELVFDRLPVTLLLVSLATMIWLVLGVALGVLAAARPGSLFDRLAGAGSIVLISTPVFVLGYMALLAFASGSDSLVPLLPGIGAYPEADDFPNRVAALILPALVLGMGLVGLYFRLARATIREELTRYYVLAARARGLGESRILWRHAFRAGLTPMLTLIGLDFALIAAGNVVLVEAVFNVPGIGGLMVTSIQRSDLPVVEGVVLFTAILVIVVNIAIDIAEGILDPRIRQPGPSRRRRSPDAVRPVRDPSTSS